MTAPLEARCDAAIARTVAHLRAIQAPDGAWKSPCNQGPAVTAQAAIVLAWVDQVDDDLAAALCRGLLDARLPDGSWPMAPFATVGDLAATATCHAALVRLGCADRAAVDLAWRFVEQRGGYEALLNSFREADAAAWYVAMAGLLDASRLPRLPMSWRRSRLVVRFLETRMHDGIQMLVLQLAAISRSLTGEWPRQAPEADARALYDLLDRYQNPDGSVCGFVPIHGLALAALHAAGDRGPRTRRGIAWLRSRLTHAGDAAWFTAYDPDIWVTGITMRALRTAGVPADDPAIRAGARWLLRGQSFRPLTRTPQRRTGVTRVGGWGFGADNVTMPDTDDTGIALLALGGVAGEAGVDAAIEAGADWLVTMQNPDGGFPAFSWNVGTRPTGRPVYLRAGEAAPLRKRVAAARAGLAILADTANEDLVARVLDALCALPRTPATQRAIDGAIAWLRSFQLEDGSFIGKWVTPYLTTTSDVLRGLRAAGLLAEDPMVRRALAWLVSKQRPDGGWGETHETAFDPSLVGQQPSLAPTTAWVLSGLIPWLGPDDPVIARGVTWLLDAQAEDGTWDNGRHTHVYLPPDRTYVLPATPAMHGLEALARWRRATR